MGLGGEVVSTQTELVTVCSPDVEIGAHFHACGWNWEVRPGEAEEAGVREGRGSVRDGDGERGVCLIICLLAPLSSETLLSAPAPGRTPLPFS